MHRSQLIRRIGQAASFFVANNHFHLNIYQGGLKRICFPGINCYACPFARFACPVGSLQYFIARHTFPYYILGFIGIIGITSGRFICGWACPFGLLQELLHGLPTVKLKLHKAVSYTKYIVLGVLVVGVVYLTQEPWFCKICPAGTLFAGIPQIATEPQLRTLIGTLFYIKCAILSLFVVSAVIISRPFCRVLCPLGAILGLLNPVSLGQLKVDKGRCKNCGTCYKACPMEIKIDNKTTNSIECIKCLKCKSVCPQTAIKITQ